MTLDLLLPLMAVLATLAVCLNAEAIGRWVGVMAIPDGQRRTHKMATPQVGGVAVLSGFGLWVVGSLAAAHSQDAILLVVLLAAGGLGLVGFVDDRHEVPPVMRILLLLVFLATAFALDPGLISSSLHWYSFGDVAVPGWVYVPLMAATAIGLVNSVNMADGQNGLVGSMFVVWSACLSIVSHGTLAAMAEVLCATSIVFLAFNLKGKIFLGDCGSYGVTFAIGLMVTLAHARNEVSLETVIVWFFIPVVDCLRLMISRPLRGRSVFHGGRDHFHHRLIDSIGRPLSVTVYIAAVAASSIGATLAPRFSLVWLCALSGFYFSFANLTDRNVGLEDGAESPDAVTEGSARKVIPISGGHDHKR
jgi:UDP-GlcNAc:undecaprenyl-phosphate GlcNAc-1-phosphate transferase